MSVGRRSQARLEMLGRRGANRRRARANAPYVALAATLLMGASLGVLHNRWHAHNQSDPVLSSVRTALVPAQTATFRAHAALTRNSSRGWPWSGNALIRENRRLKAEVARLKVENEQMRADAEEAIRLREAAGFASRQRTHPFIAPVIGLSPSPLFDTLTLGRGTRDGLREAQVVRTPDGLVGQISVAGPISSTVLLLSDPGSGVSAYVVRPGEAKVRGVGIVQGQGRGRPLRLDYLRSEDDVRAGDRVVSSGLGGVMPADILIGTVVSVSEDKARALKTALVRPAALAQHARDVLVLP